MFVFLPLPGAKDESGVVLSGKVKVSYYSMWFYFEEAFRLGELVLQPSSLYASSCVYVEEGLQGCHWLGLMLNPCRPGKAGEREKRKDQEKARVQSNILVLEVGSNSRAFSLFFRERHHLQTKAKD